MDTTTNSSPLEVALMNAVKDDDNLLTNLNNLKEEKQSMFAIVSELPSYPDPDIMIAYVQRWRDVEKLFDRDLRIFAWSYNTLSEKYVLGLVQNMPRIFVTVLPAELRRKDK